jgi:hypothetical protein
LFCEILAQDVFPDIRRAFCKTTGITNFVISTIGRNLQGCHNFPPQQRFLAWLGITHGVVLQEALDLLIFTYGYIFTIFRGELFMSIETGAAISRQRLQEMKGRMLALKEHL